IHIHSKHNVNYVAPPTDSDPLWSVRTTQHQSFFAPILMIASGGSPAMWKLLKALGHEMVAPVPSLFTFNISDPRISGLAGLSLPEIQVKIPDNKLESAGPGLITHWGLSGPGILRLSAWGARELNGLQYTFPLEINWLGNRSAQRISQLLQGLKQQSARRQLSSPVSLDLPHRLWQQLVTFSGIPPEKRWGNLTSKELEHLGTLLSKSLLKVKGKSTFKEEFVTAGGIALKEIHFKHFESKRFPNLFFAGEVLDIDAITGGFNFQAAWTGGWIAGQAMGRRFEV
ncbi:MAG: aminoacetone oxidase family FAD-binding enzyme, partial [Bacteroidota bacterium]